MKVEKLKPMTIGWSELFKPHKVVIPKGYSSAEEIARKLNVHVSTVRPKLKRLREEDKIACQEIKIGRVKAFYYKD